MGTVAKSSITLSSVSDAYSASLTPTSCVIHADFDGSNPQLSNSYTTISVFCGDTKAPISISISDIVVSNENIGFDIVKVDDFNYMLSITSLHPSVLDGYIDVPVLAGIGLLLSVRFSFTVVRESSMLDWIQDWENNKTTIGGSYIITPKLFVGKRITGNYNSINEVQGLTGVYIGPSDNNSSGLYGYKDSVEIFHLDETGGKIGGWDMLKGGIYSSDGRLRILSDGHIKAVNDEGDAVWEINADGSASFAMENVRFYADGSAEFKGKIVSSEGKVGGWTIDNANLYNTQIGLNSIKKYVAIANIVSIPTITVDAWDGDHIAWVKAYGGVAMYYNQNTDYGFIGYKDAKKVFSAGSSNYIAGWNFDDSAIWLGTKNNNVSQYTSATGNITIGTNGLRGYTWFINTDGTASFVKGYVQFNQTSGILAGWTFDATAIYIGEKATSGFTSKSGSITLGANGLRGHKWRLESDGSGAIAAGSIIWDINGNVTFADSVSLSWGNISNAIGNKLTKIDANGLYTGTLNANQIVAGTIDATKINADSILSNGDAWGLNKDGSGHLANKNINWDKDGNVKVVGSIAQQFEIIRAEDFAVAPSGQYKVAPLKMVHNFLITSDTGLSINPVLLLPCAIEYNGITINILFSPKNKIGSAVWIRPWKLMLICRMALIMRVLLKIMPVY